MELASEHLRLLTGEDLERAHDAARVWEKEEFRSRNFALAYYWRAVGTGIVLEISRRYGVQVVLDPHQLALFDSPGIAPEVRH